MKCSNKKKKKFDLVKQKKDIISHFFILSLAEKTQIIKNYNL